MTTWSHIRTLGSNIESAALSLVSQIAPWLGPLPTAWLVYDRTMTHLAWPEWVALTASISLEFLGIATSVTALQLWVYRRTKLKSEPDAPLTLPIALAATYFISAELLTVVLDIATLTREQIGAAHFAPALFPVLSLVSVTLLAVRQANADAFLSANERKAKRKQANAEQSQKEPKKAKRETHIARCEFCNWSRDGYKTKRAATNARNAHKCKEVTCWCGRSFEQLIDFKAHQEVHKSEARNADSVAAALAVFQALYSDAWENEQEPVSKEQIREWRK